MSDSINDVSCTSNYKVKKKVAGRMVPGGATTPPWDFYIINLLYLITF